MAVGVLKIIGGGRDTIPGIVGTVAVGSVTDFGDRVILTTIVGTVAVGSVTITVGLGTVEGVTMLVGMVTAGVVMTTGGLAVGLLGTTMTQVVRVFTICG